ncbi:MAG: CPBP family intramembrane metalloprotease [Lentisphaeraceae bacterium]|nr:CPBP family intramembrane metalloprotease [Lentisphaeraceae bacterium]
MRPLLVFAAFMAYTFTLGSLLSYPLYQLLQSLFSEGTYLGDVSFGKVANRSFMIVAFTGIFPTWKALQCHSKNDMGYDLPREQFFKGIFSGTIFGMISMLVLTGCILGFGVRIIEPKITSSIIINDVLHVIPLAIAVALIEETFFRGIMLKGMLKKLKPAVAVIILSSVFASIHFIRNKSNTQAVDLNWLSGFVHLRNSFNNFADPAFIGSWLTLFWCGCFLSLIVLKNGNIAQSIGVNAGWVLILGVTKKITDDNLDSDLNWMIGNYDKITGYLSFFVLTIICTVYYFCYMKNVRRKNSDEQKRQSGA